MHNIYNITRKMTICDGLYTAKITDQNKLILAKKIIFTENN